MSVHIIDATRPLPPTKEDDDHALDLANGDVVLLAAGSEIAAYGYNANGIYGGFGTTLLIDGRVYSKDASAIKTQGVINIGASGEVSGAAGLYLSEDYLNHGTSVVSNQGSILATDVGIYIDGARSTINNSGIIFGDTAIYHYSSYDPGEILTINNTGVIKGTGGTAILGAVNGSNFVTNQGRIEGDVFIGGNGWREPAGPWTHVYDGRGGTIAGTVYFAAGNDIAYGGDGSETFVLGVNNNFVDGGGGSDTLTYNFKATVDLRITAKQQTGSYAWDTIQNIENLNGSILADRFIGSTAANTLVGNAGNDSLIGYDGNDLLSGGAGDDLLQGGKDTDTAVFTGKFSDYTITADGAGIIITDNRASGDGIDHLIGVEFALFNDRLFTLPLWTQTVTPPSAPTTPEPSTSAPTPASPTQPSEPTIAPVHVIAGMQLTGSRKANVLVGSAGNDHLNGGLGRDKLTGNDGQDVFAFTTRLKKNVDVITDFRSEDDTIQLSKAVFSKIKVGALSKSAFHIGTKAKDKSDRIIYNEDTGVLSYDRDGSGKVKAVTFAKLEPKAVLQADDFWIV